MVNTIVSKSVNISFDNKRKIITLPDTDRKFTKIIDGAISLLLSRTEDWFISTLTCTKKCYSQRTMKQGRIY